MYQSYTNCCLFCSTTSTSAPLWTNSNYSTDLSAASVYKQKYCPKP